MALRATQFTRWLMGAATMAVSAQAFSQSTATRIEEGTLEEVTVSAEKITATGLIQSEQATKSRTTVSNEYLTTQSAGQSVIQSLNLVPGVNFTNSDPYGASGGNLRLRSFDNNRISLMLDGIQLNDTGNYAIFSGQQLDSEIVESVTVNLGTSDVDSPTASATGGTINMVTVRPKDDFSMIVKPSVGDDSYWRLFLRGDTGTFGPWETKAFVTASQVEYDKFKGPGQLEKTQVNARIYQDLGDDDFVSLALHGNRQRNDSYRNLSLADIRARGYDFDNDPTCLRPAAGVGRQDESTTTCTSYYGVRTNPADTANIRGQSSFGLTDSLRLTVDPAFQYTLANGGGYTLFNENDRRLIGNSAASGVDLNGDGDTADNIGLYTPNNTNTRRYSLNTSLLWMANETNLLRFSYTLDYGRHRQTGQHGFLQVDGDPQNVFAGRKGAAVTTADGADLRGRDRYSVAKLNQFSLSYTGKMLDDTLHLNLGVRAPFFERELNQYCYTSLGVPGGGSATIAAGLQYCSTQVPTPTASPTTVTFTGVTGNFLTPYAGTKKYDKILPNVGLSFEPAPDHMLYASFAKGLSAPRTDNLYSIEILDLEPETTTSYDLGYRYQTPLLTGSVALWKSDYENRIVSSFDPDLGLSVDRNVGPVDLYGVDAALGMEIVEDLTVYLSTSYIHSEVQRDIQISATSTVASAGKELVETPDWTVGSRIEYAMGPVTLGVQGKYVDDRWATDVNDEAAPAYTVVDADVRYDFKAFGMESFLQVNVINVADRDYLGSIATSRFFSGPGSLPLYSIGAPRTFQFTFQTGF